MAAQIVAGAEPEPRIEVRAERPYPVLVGTGLLAEVPGPARRGGAAGRGDPPADHDRTWPPGWCAGSPRPDWRRCRLEVPDAEAAKTAEVAAHCWAVLGRAGFTRSDAVVGVGGGSTTDLAGFVAATWLRGVPLVNLPTTVLGMVDAAVGGRPGSTPPQGKNLVGSFHEPVGVLCDLDCWRTLPAADLVGRTGRGGQVRLHRRPGDPRPCWSPIPRRRCDPGPRRCASSSSGRSGSRREVVSADLREATSVGTRVGRELLNYGHTLGHAIERREGYRIGTARPSASAWSSSPSWPGGPVGSISDGRPARGDPVPARAAHGLRAGRLRRAARRDGGGQEGPWRHAAVRDPERAGQPGDPGRAGQRSLRPASSDPPAPVQPRRPAFDLLNDWRWWSNRRKQCRCGR